MIFLKFGVGLLLLVTFAVAKDDSKWVWGDGKSRQSANNRYEVSEDYEYPPQQGPQNFRPTFGLNRPDHTPIHEPRPDGVYGGNYGNYGVENNNGGGGNSGVLTGPVPSWVKEGPYKNFDKCKCSEKFNCNSPGISYGHCDVGKSYCCYTTKKENQAGGPWPSKPVHSPENGVLVGPGGPYDRPPIGGAGGGRPVGNYPRPPLYNNHNNQGSYGRPGRPGYGPGPIYNGGGGGSRPIHSIENGVLVGPGGPFDRPPPNNFGYGPRNAKN